jgi:gas vesicle protein
MNDLLKTIAPLLGTALGGPLGGAAAAFIADKLGLESKDVKAVGEALSGNKLQPDQITQIKLAEIEFEKFCKQNAIDVAKLDFDNTKDARDMQKTTRSYFPATLSSGIVVGFFGILTSMLVFEYKPTEPLLIMLGALGAAFGAVVNFWLGSSNGSQRKDQMLLDK